MSLPFSNLMSSSFDHDESCLDRKRKAVDEAHTHIQLRGAEDLHVATAPLEPLNSVVVPSEPFARLLRTSRTDGRNDEALVDGPLVPNNVLALQGGPSGHGGLQQSLEQPPSDLVAFLQAHRSQRQRSPLLHGNDTNLPPFLERVMAEQPLLQEVALSSPVQMAVARLLWQEESRMQSADYNQQMVMSSGRQEWNNAPIGALASSEQTNRTLPLPSLDSHLWQLPQQQLALLRERHLRSSNNIDPNWNNALRMAPPLTSPGFADVQPALESHKIQLAWQAEDAPYIDRKVPPTMLPTNPNSIKIAKTAGVPSPQNSSLTKPEDPWLSSCRFVPRPLAHVNDHLVLSQHQIFLRQQIEVFCATEADINVRARGRNKRITVGQVGIRCRYCAHLPCRQKGSLYYPSSTLGLYQAAQNMSTTHMQCGLCVAMPDEVKKQFADLIPTKTLGSLRGRSYWSNSAKEMGLVDTVDQGIRYAH
jgi:hypothetical protein